MIRKNTLLATLFVVGASVASVAQADAVTHFAPTERGIVYHPGAATSKLTRAQVAADLAAAQQQPGWDVISRVGERPNATVGAKSRSQVLAELQAARQQPGWDNAARNGEPMRAGGGSQALRAAR